MAVWNPPPTIVTGQTLPSGIMNTYARDNDVALARPALHSAYLTADQSIPNITWTTVAFNASLFTNNFAMNSSQCQPLVNVKCLVSATLYWASNATGLRGLRLWDNSNAQEYGGDLRNAVSLSYTEQSTTVLIPTTSASLIIVQAYQSSGGALTLTSGAPGRTAIHLLGVYWN